MQQVTPEEAQAHFAELLAAASAGEEIIIVAAQNKFRLQPLPNTSARRKAGSAKGIITIAPDFDAPLSDFEEYTF